MKILVKLIVIAAIGSSPLLTSCTSTGKGAAIGAGGGAVAGAIIADDGNKAGGALLGAGIGAGAGALMGKNREQERRIEDLERETYRR